MTIALSGKNVAVVGYGLTGQACLRFLQKQGAKVTLFDDALHRTSDQDVILHDISVQSLKTARSFAQFDWVVVSPGINLNLPVFTTVAATQVIGDIELFAHFNQVPVVAITGSNGKTTVTDLLGAIFSHAGKKVLLGGNYGFPVLDMLEQPADIIVLELSSFQLESTHSLVLESAAILNVSPDHLDRHLTLENYIAMKQRIFLHAKHVVVNRQDTNTYPVNIGDRDSIEGSRRPTPAVESVGNDETTTGFGLHAIKSAITFNGSVFMPIQNVTLQGEHNLFNIQVAAAIALRLGISHTDIVDAISTYKGMPHRFEWVAEQHGVTFINDSKATNIGATAAALSSLSTMPFSTTILIAGGEGKGADLSELGGLIAKQIDTLILIGKDGDVLSTFCEKCFRATTMEDAVELAKQHASNNSIVLLSPACASIDMFDNYQARGKAFVDAVIGNTV